MAKPVDRRNFLKSTVTGMATLAASAGVISAESVPPQSAQTDSSTSPQEVTVEHPGSDFMVDVLKSVGFEYICANPGSQYRGLAESVVSYGGNKNPEFITCSHEETAVAMAHGYAKIEGKPLCVTLHGTVGLQHASMAIYQAYCDLVPVYLIVGNTLDVANRRPHLDNLHCAQDIALMVRDCLKWDDLPWSLQHFAESAVRAYTIAMTPPMGPVMLVADRAMQERSIPEGSELHIPKLCLPAPPQGDSGAVAEAARLLVQAQNPVILVDRSARSQDGVDHLVELAEALQAPVLDQYGRMNFPSRHPLNHSDGSRGLIAGADVILGLEVQDFWGTVNDFPDRINSTWQPIYKPGTKLINITSRDLYMKSNYQDLHRFTEVDLDIAGDVEATVPSLTEAIKRQTTSNRNSEFQARGAKLATARQVLLDRARTDASYGWDASPVSTARLTAELWNAVKDEDWSLLSYIIRPFSRWPVRLWDFKKHYQFIGGPGAFAIGYNAPATVGAALANRKHGRLSVSIQCDGDLMYGPGVLWTAAHHRIPLLIVMHNNRAYHAETMQTQIMANDRNRGIGSDIALIHTSLGNPDIDYSKMAQSMGVYGEGAITDPKDLGAALRRAVAVVKRGEPALVDVVTQGR